MEYVRILPKIRQHPAIGLGPFIKLLSPRRCFDSILCILNLNLLNAKSNYFFESRSSIIFFLILYIVITIKNQFCRGKKLSVPIYNEIAKLES